MTADQATQRQASAVNCNAELLRELRHAHQIIHNALNLMTTEQKFAWGEANAGDLVDGDGITRFYEREAVIKKASAAAGDRA
ncbi:hypothetical protein [Cupriavidus pampae]|uniref:Uncharacterized protein n=1 Tax=Cupriavidus pampae TaxID=659251 RepID=A0ABM8XCB7_9BURK|nr:hypothetical protein [Cupriavidus pampae]CAG9177635.1 hypothetical protein LMG32289_03862 [Cupriavidus pampae]